MPSGRRQRPKCQLPLLPTAARQTSLQIDITYRLKPTGRFTLLRFLNLANISFKMLGAHMNVAVTEVPILRLNLVSPTPLPLLKGSIPTQSLVQAANIVNDRLRKARSFNSLVGLDLFDVIDLRMLSGLIGEMFSLELANLEANLLKNPNIDGYPDLCDVSLAGARETCKAASADFFIEYPHGGLEVKNTFGVKKTGVEIQPRATRIGKIQKTLVWKAHHQKTNNLIALQSDYVDGVPQIVSAFFSKELLEEDWSVKQQPKAGSTMTSFSQTKPTAFSKLKAGQIFNSNFSG